jgi:oligopeptide transport system ATP-binding protein
MADTVLEVQQLTKFFPVTRGFFKRTVGRVRAVDRVSFRVKKGETFGLVGESGCGKTTLGRCILQLIPPSSGKVLFEEEEICCVYQTRPKKLSEKMQVVFQDPYSSLNPRHTIKDIVTEPLVIQGRRNRTELDEAFRRQCSMVGLQEEMGSRYPHMLSGGQQQRVNIARSMIIQPSFVVCDEPVSSLDVSIRAQIINLLMSLQEKLGVSYLFISHDLSVVHHISHQIGVMYLGKFVEISPKAELYKNPLHPYTQALLSAIAVPDPVLERKRRRIIVQGEVPSAVNIPQGCCFHPRCAKVMKICSEEEPVLLESSPGHWTACHLYSQMKLSSNID